MLTTTPQIDASQVASVFQACGKDGVVQMRQRLLAFQALEGMDPETQARTVDTVSSMVDKVEQQTHVLLLGPISSGKSSFLNSLLEAELAPSAHTHQTSMLMEVHYSDTPALKLERMDGSTPDDEAVKVTASPGEDLVVSAERIRTRVSAITREISAEDAQHYIFRLYWPSPLLSSGLVVVDSPGLNRTQEQSELVTRYAESVLAVFLLHPAENPAISENIADHVRALLSGRGSLTPDRVCFVLTKCDRIKRNNAESLATREHTLVGRWMAILGASPTWVTRNYTRFNPRGVLECRRLGIWHSGLDLQLGKVYGFLGNIVRFALFDALTTLAADLRPAMQSLGQDVQSATLSASEADRERTFLKQVQAAWFKIESGLKKQVKGDLKSTLRELVEDESVSFGPELDSKALELFSQGEMNPDFVFRVIPGGDVTQYCENATDLAFVVIEREFNAVFSSLREAALDEIIPSVESLLRNELQHAVPNLDDGSVEEGIGVFEIHQIKALTKSVIGQVRSRIERKKIGQTLLSFFSRVKEVIRGMFGKRSKKKGREHEDWDVETIQDRWTEFLSRVWRVTREEATQDKLVKVCSDLINETRNDLVKDTLSSLKIHYEKRERLARAREKRTDMASVRSEAASRLYAARSWVVSAFLPPSSALIPRLWLDDCSAASSPSKENSVVAAAPIHKIPPLAATLAALVATQGKFVNALGVLVQDYLWPILDSQADTPEAPILDAEETSRVFLTISTLERVHSDLLDELVWACFTSPQLSDVLSQVADVLAESDMTAFMPSHQAFAESTLRDNVIDTALKANEAFAQLKAQVEAAGQAGRPRLPLKAGLSAPYFHACKLPLVLDRVLAFLDPSLPLGARVGEVQTTFDNAVKDMNNQLRNQAIRVADDALFTRWNLPKAASRRRELDPLGPVVCDGIDACVLHLFNDCLVVTSGRDQDLLHKFNLSQLVVISGGGVGDPREVCVAEGELGKTRRILFPWDVACQSFVDVLNKCVSWFGGGPDDDNDDWVRLLETNSGVLQAPAGPSGTQTAAAPEGGSVGQVSMMGVDDRTMRAICSFFMEWSKELMAGVVQQREQMANAAATSALVNHPSPNVVQYYRVVYQQLTDSILACKSMHSQFVNVSYEVHNRGFFHEHLLGAARAAGHGALSVATAGAAKVILSALSFGGEMMADSHRRHFVQGVGALCRSINEIDAFAELVARTLTDAKLATIVALRPEPDANSQSGFLARMRERWQEFVADEYTSVAAQTALTDTLAVLNAAASDYSREPKDQIVHNQPDVVSALVKTVVPDFTGRDLTPPTRHRRKGRRRGGADASPRLSTAGALEESAPSLEDLFASLQEVKARELALDADAQARALTPTAASDAL